MPQDNMEDQETGDAQVKMDPGDLQDHWVQRDTEDLMDCLAFLVSRAVLVKLVYQDQQVSQDLKVDEVMRENQVIQGCQDPRVLEALQDLVVHQGLWDPLVQMGTPARQAPRDPRACPDLQALKERQEKLDLLAHLVLRGVWVHQAYRAQWANQA